MKPIRIARLARVTCTLAILASLSACNPDEPTTKELKEASAKRCKEDYGFKPGTDAYGNCRMQLERDYYQAMQSHQMHQSSEVGRGLQELNATTRVNQVKIVP